jgi:hypothetical protein
MVVVQSPGRSCMTLRWLRVLVLALSLVGASAFSASTPPALKASINELAPRARRAAPEWIEVTLSSRSTALREGALEFTMIEWGEEIYRYRTHDLVINSGDQTFRFLLPAATATGSNSDRTIELKLIEKAGITPIGMFPLVSRQKNARAHVIAVIRPAYRSVGNETNPVWQALRLERLAGKDGPEFDTTPIFFDPTDVPNDPLGFCAFDLVLVERDALGAMREKARSALFQWVNAGGSLCVMADSGLQAETVDSLNALANADPRWKPVTLDAAGRPQVPGGLALGRVNFGRLAIAAEPPKDDPEKVPTLWRRASAFLWKMRTEHAATVEAEGKWLSTDHMRHGLSFLVPNPALNQLMPGSVRVLPLWILATLLAVFIALVGPADWFLLGALKRRRLTWISLPLVSICVTATTVFAVQRFMGRETRQRSLIISDLGVSGRVIRETRIELELPSRERTAVTASTNAFRLPLVPGHVHRRATPGNAWTDIEFRGQYPGRYDYIQPQRQWTPQLTRVTRIADAPDTSGVLWDAFDEKRITGRWSGHLAPEMSPGVPCNFDFFVGGAEPRPTGDGPIHSEWRQAITALSPRGLGALLTQESPSGFASLDDLPFVETGDPSVVVLVAAKNEGDNIHIWRRIYFR